MSRKLFRLVSSVEENSEEVSGFFQNIFTYRMILALKESNETIYCLKLLNRLD